MGLRPRPKRAEGRLPPTRPLWNQAACGRRRRTAYRGVLAGSAKQTNASVKATRARLATKQRLEDARGWRPSHRPNRSPHVSASGSPVVLAAVQPAAAAAAASIAPSIRCSLLATRAQPLLARWRAAQLSGRRSTARVNIDVMLTPVGIEAGHRGASRSAHGNARCSHRGWARSWSSCRHRAGQGLRPGPVCCGLGCLAARQPACVPRTRAPSSVTAVWGRELVSPPTSPKGGPSAPAGASEWAKSVMEISATASQPRWESRIRGALAVHESKGIRARTCVSRRGAARSGSHLERVYGFAFSALCRSLNARSNKPLQLSLLPSGHYIGVAYWQLALSRCSRGRGPRS